MFSPTAFPYNSLPVVDVNGTVALAYAKPLIRLDTTTLIDGAGKGRYWTLRSILLTTSYRCSRRSSISWYSSSPNRPDNPILQIRSLTSSPTPPGRCSTLAQWRNKPPRGCRRTLVRLYLHVSAVPRLLRLRYKELDDHARSSATGLLIQRCSRHL